MLEDLNTKAMTKSAKGTVEKSGRNVQQKAGLNRAILASGWGPLERKLAYKAGQVVYVEPAGSRRTPITTRRSTSRCGRDFCPHPFRPAGPGLLHGEEHSLPLVGLATDQRDSRDP